MESRGGKVFELCFEYNFIILFLEVVLDVSECEGLTIFIYK